MTREKERTAQVHRFRDFVAGHIGRGPTEYLTPKEARAIAKALIECARSIEKESFCGSGFTTRNFDLLPLKEGNDKPDYTHTRKESRHD